MTSAPHRLSFRIPARISVLAATLAAALVGTPSSAAAQAFGKAAAVVGDEVLFGEPESFQRPGTVRVYRAADDETWEEVATLTGSDGVAGDGFGASIAASGDRLIVGAPGADDTRGAAYVFERREGGWHEAAKLTVTDGRPGERLGGTVALEDDLALAATEDSKLFSMQGMVEAMLGPATTDRAPAGVHAFRHDGSAAWRHAGRLMADDGEARIGFGGALALEDGVTFVGAAMRNGLTGAVLVYTEQEGEWVRSAEIAGPGPGSGFGASLALDESGRLLVGAPRIDQSRGDVLVFERNPESGEWTESARLRGALDGVMMFGASIAARGGRVLIGARTTAYATRLDPDAGSFSEPAVLEIERPPQTELLPVEVALGPDLAATGFPGQDFFVGTGAIFRAAADVAGADDDAAAADDGADDSAWQLATTVTGGMDALPAVTGGEVRCTDGTAASFDCSSVDLLAFLPVSDIGGGRGVQVNDLWGWTDPETGREYAIVGRGDGTAFVDLTDPSAPVYVGELPRTAGSPLSLWRDIKVHRDHAFVVADNSGPHGMQVFDLTRLRDVDDMPTTFGPDVLYENVHSAHNVVVNPEADMAIVVSASGGGETCGQGLHMIDIADPLAPRFAGCFTHTAAGSPMAGLTHDAQCVVYAGPDEEHRGRHICLNSNLPGLVIADVTDPAAPRELSVGQYPGSALPHQGWLTEDQRYFLMGDEGDEMQGLVPNTRLLVWDVSDLDDPLVHAEYFHPTRAIDHNVYVLGDRAYQANYDAGLRILDISDVEHIEEVGFFDTVPFGRDEPIFHLGAWSVYPYFESGTIAVTSGAEGLFLLRHRPEEPVS